MTNKNMKRFSTDSPGKNTGVGCLFLLQCLKVKVKLLSRVQLLVTAWTEAYQAPRSMGFSRQVYWSGEPLSWVLSRLLEPGDVSALLQVPDALIVILFWAKAMVTVAKS